MKVTVLGSGTSLGVPVIGCDCEVCRSDDPRNKRLRSSILVESAETRLLVDVTPDFRTQALRKDIRRVDAVLMTHEHADHISGLDDLRIFGFQTKAAVPVYSNRTVRKFIEDRFSYAFNPMQRGGGVPHLDLRLIEEPTRIGDILVTPVPVVHGKMEILGFRFGDFGYITDASYLPDESMALLGGVNVLILNALRRRRHPTHFSLDEAIEVARKLSPEITYLTHLTDDFDHEPTNRSLPEGIELAYDELEIDIDGAGKRIAVATDEAADPGSDCS